MGLAPGAAIVTPDEVAAITLEAGLKNLDSPADGATLQNAVIQATNALIVDLKRRRGIDPQVITNVSDLKRAAAFYVAMTRYASAPQGAVNGDLAQRKVAYYQKLYEQEITTVLLETALGHDVAENAPKGLPTVLNLDAEPYLNRPVDNRRPGRFGFGPWRPA